MTRPPYRTSLLTGEAGHPLALMVPDFAAASSGIHVREVAYE